MLSKDERKRAARLECYISKLERYITRYRHKHFIATKHRNPRAPRAPADARDLKLTLYLLSVRQALTDLRAGKVTKTPKRKRRGAVNKRDKQPKKRPTAGSLF